MNDEPVDEPRIPPLTPEIRDRIHQKVMDVFSRAPKGPVTVRDETGVPCQFQVEEDVPGRLVIRDLDLPGHRSVTNAAAEVVRVVMPCLRGRQLLYYDSDGNLDELLVNDGRFAGYKCYQKTGRKP